VNCALLQLTRKKINALDSKGNPIKGSLALFLEYLTILFTEESQRLQVIEPFTVIQALQSTGFAHRKGKITKRSWPDMIWKN
jgi:hypothetical protein